MREAMAEAATAMRRRDMAVTGARKALATRVKRCESVVMVFEEALPGKSKWPRGSPLRARPKQAAPPMARAARDEPERRRTLCVQARRRRATFFSATAARRRARGRALPSSRLRFKSSVRGRGHHSPSLARSLQAPLRPAARRHSRAAERSQLEACRHQGARRRRRRPARRRVRRGQPPPGFNAGGPPPGYGGMASRHPAIQVVRRRRAGHGGYGQPPPG